MCVIGYLAVSAGSIVLSIVLLITAIWRKLSKQPRRPVIEEQYWGAGKPQPDNPDIVPFQIKVSDEDLEDLHRRLNSVRPLTPPLEDSNFRYGFNSDYLQRVVRFWRDEYDWRAREAFLNALPQFTTQLGGLRVHFVRAAPAQVPAGTRVLPLLLLHGWPGSVREFYELVPLLTAPRAGADFVFEVVAPSLPGYGFSEGARKQGLGPAQMGVLMHALMQRLGHKQYYVQGGDWGHAVGASISILYPESILGFHTNVCFFNTLLSNIKLYIGSFFPGLYVDKEHFDRVYPMSKNFMFLLEESGYFHLQATKPDTVGVALRDSPAGLAAYILEKFSTWTNKDWRDLPDGGLLKKYSLEKLLDNIMIYWVTGTITTSMRTYSEFATKKNTELQWDSVPCTVPTAIANFANEIGYIPEKIARDKFVNLVHFSHFETGGHFAAFEEPELLAGDIWTAVDKFRKLKVKK